VERHRARGCAATCRDVRAQVPVPGGPSRRVRGARASHTRSSIGRANTAGPSSAGIRWSVRRSCGLCVDALARHAESAFSVSQGRRRLLPLDPAYRKERPSPSCCRTRARRCLVTPGWARRAPAGIERPRRAPRCRLRRRRRQTRKPSPPSLLQQQNPAYVIYNLRLDRGPEGVLRQPKACGTIIWR